MLQILIEHTHIAQLCDGEKISELIAICQYFTYQYRIAQNFDSGSLTKFDESSMSETLTSKTLTN